VTAWTEQDIAHLKVKGRHTGPSRAAVAGAGASSAPPIPAPKGYPHFPAVCVAAGLPEPVAEYRFAPPRRWRFDFAWTEHKVALEVDGGVFTNGRHTRGAGVLKDMEKLNTAAIAGWRVVRCTPQQLLTLGVEVATQAIRAPRF
jgi:hypothetical protein